MTAKTQPFSKVELLNYMGEDTTVVNAARVSMAKWHEEFDGEKDAKLIAYLANNEHWTPFAHPQICLRITTPIFVARQWFKSTVGLTRNETSRRYVDAPPEMYLPDLWHKRPDKSIKQGAGSALDDEINEDVKDIAQTAYNAAVDAYDALLAKGIAPEEARMVLPQGMMTTWIETGSLAAYCRIAKQRLDPHAQRATREVAEQVAVIVSQLFPVSWSALMGIEGDV